MTTLDPDSSVDAFRGKLNVSSPKLKLDELFVTWLSLPETQQSLNGLFKGNFDFEWDFLKSSQMSTPVCHSLRVSMLHTSSRHHLFLRPMYLIGHLHSRPRLHQLLIEWLSSRSLYILSSGI